MPRTSRQHSPSPSPDPLDCVDDPLTPPSGDNTDSSPPVRKPWGRVPPSVVETPSDMDDSPPVRRPTGRAHLPTIDDDDEDDDPGVDSAEEDDPAPEGAIPNLNPRRLRLQAADLEDDRDDMVSFPSPHDKGHARSPRPDSPDGDVFGMLPRRPRSIWPSTGDSIPATQAAFHLDNIGAVWVPIRTEPEYPQALRDAEAQMGSQIASALTNPNDEGLNSETFYTLLDTFLYPRFTGCNSKEERFKLHQYSQLHAVAATFTSQLNEPSPNVARKRKHKGSDGPDPDPNTEKHIKAVKERRVPDMTTLAMFEKRVPLPNSSFYQHVSRKGPKICITEIKSFDWPGEQKTLEYAVEIPMSKAHYQNYVAAQYLFREDEHLQRVGSFVGTGPVWSFSEFCRWDYPLLFEQPLPITEEQALEWEESEAVKSPRQPKKKAKRSSTPPDVSVEEKEYPKFLGDFPKMPPQGTELEEIFRRHEAQKAKRGRRQKVSFLNTLEPDGRTYEAFDVIVKNMRGWYGASEGNADPDHRLIFDPDPYEQGTCPATVAKRQAEQQARVRN